jgi:HAMP domain-containing protein
MNIIQTIARANYAATGAQVALLAHAVTLGKFGESTYLNVLTRTFRPRQARVGARCRPMWPRPSLTRCTRSSTRMYSRACSRTDSAMVAKRWAKEVNRRSTFARTSASELRGFIARGGDIRTLEVGTITRAQLRKFGVAVPTGTRAERSLQKSTEAIERAARRVARGDPDAALERINAAIEALQAVAEEIEAGAEGRARHDYGRGRASSCRGSGRSSYAGRRAAVAPGRVTCTRSR